MTTALREEEIMTDKQYFGVWKSAYLLVKSQTSQEDSLAALFRMLDDQSRKEVLAPTDNRVPDSIEPRE